MKLRYKEIKFEIICNIDEILPKIFYVDKYYSVLREYKFKDKEFCFEDNVVEYIYSDFDMDNEFTATLSAKEIEELVETGGYRGALYTNYVKGKERLEELKKEEEKMEEEAERELYKQLKNKFDVDDLLDEEEKVI